MDVSCRSRLRELFFESRVPLKNGSLPKRTLSLSKCLRNYTKYAVRFDRLSQADSTTAYLQFEFLEDPSILFCLLRIEIMICIIDYNAGNLTSVKRALDHLGIANVISADPQTIANADRVIFPGVGHAASAMATIKERHIDESLKAAFAQGKPILGICLGTQIILSHTQEGDTDTLSLIPGQTKRFTFSDPTTKIPHMGWNGVQIVKPHPLLKNISSNSEMYFVHSFYPVPDDSSAIHATCEYDNITFAAAIGSKNLFATQFHPEKSGELGLSILSAFAKWDGAPC